MTRSAAMFHFTLLLIALSRWGGTHDISTTPVVALLGVLSLVLALYYIVVDHLPVKTA